MSGLLLIPLLSAASFAAEFPGSEAAFFSALGRHEAFIEPMKAAGQSDSLPSHRQLLKATLKSLAGSEVPASFVRDAFADPQVREIPEIAARFATAAETLPYEKYREIFITKDRIEKGAAFYADHATLLADVERRYGVDALLLVGLIGVETRFGSNQGKYPVFDALYTIARDVATRSPWAQRELSAYLTLCYRERLDPQSVLGSYAGAFGYFQFMPTSFNAYAVDFDGDGHKRWQEWPDVLGSVANFLVEHGYQPGPDESQGSPVWKALHGYNPSNDYVRVVLELRQEIVKELAKPKP